MVSKLVRDKIPEIIRNNGENPSFYIANEKEYWVKLKEKLIEEATEFRDNPSKEEFADILEVIETIGKFKRFDKNEITQIKTKKSNEKGKFEKRIILKK